VPHPAAEATHRLPGRVRRQYPPGVQSRHGDERATLAGYLQEATSDTRGPDDAAAGGPGCAQPTIPRPGSRRNPPWLSRPCRAAAAGGRTAAAYRHGCPCRQPPRTPPGAASGQLRVAPAITAGQRARAGQTLTRARPFRRRAERTARPARVRIRSRNPCTLARRRLFGWNVRLLTGFSRWGSYQRPPRPPAQRMRKPRRGWPDQRTLRGRPPPVKPAGPEPAREAGSAPAGCHLRQPVTVRNPRCLPNACGRPPLGCAQRSRMRRSGTGGDRRIPARRRAEIRPGRRVQRAQPVDKPVDHMWGREVDGQ
jgi:hypothetical protein